MDKNPLISAACRIVGSQAELARAVGVKPPTVQQWVNGERPVPAGRCAAIERATNGAITRKELRPDDWHLYWPELARAKKRTVERRTGQEPPHVMLDRRKAAK